MGTVEFRMDADEARAVQAFQRVIQKQREAERQLGRTTRESNKMSRAQRRAGRDGASAGDKIAGGMKRAVAVMGGVTAAIGTIVAGMRAAREEAERASTLVKGVEDPFKRLVQISGGDPGRLESLTSTARSISHQEGLGLPEAAGVVFTAESLGLGRELPSIAPFARVGDLNTALRSVGKIRSIFGDKAGSAQSILSKLLTSAATSEVDVDTIAQQAIKAAPEFAAIGASDEELLAAMSIQAKAAGSPEMAATQIASLARVMRKEGVTGGLRSGLQQLGPKDPLVPGPVQMPGLREAIGRESKAFSGLTGIESKFGEFLDTLAKVEDAEALSGTRESPLQEAIRLAEGNPQLASRLNQRRAKARRESGEVFGDLGTDQLAFDAAMETLRRRSQERGRPGFWRGIGEFGLEGARKFGIEDFFIGDEIEAQRRRASLGEMRQLLPADPGFSRSQGDEMIELQRKMVEGVNRIAGDPVRNPNAHR